MIQERQRSILILCACLLWAVDLLVRYPLSLKISFEAIVFLESLVGLLFVSPWLVKNAATLVRLKRREWFIAMFIGGIGMSAAGYLQTACIQKGTPGLFSFIQVFQPLFVVFVARLFLKERVDNMYLSWGIWVVLSAILMFSIDLQLMLSSEIVFTDILIALSTMLIWGLCTILGKEFLAGQSVMTLVSLRCFFAFLFSSAILFFEQESIPMEVVMSVDVWQRFLFIGAIAGVFSMSLYYKGLKILPAGKVSFIEISYSAFGMIFSAIYTFESLSFFQLLGATSFFAFLVLFLTRGEASSTASPIRAR